MTIGKKLLYSMGALSATALLLGYSGLNSVNKLGGELHTALGHTGRQIKLFGDLKADVFEFRFAFRSIMYFALLGKPAEGAVCQQQFETVLGHAIAVTREIGAMAGSEAGKASAGEMVRALEQYRTTAREVFATGNAATIADAQRDRLTGAGSLVNTLVSKALAAQDEASKRRAEWGDSEVSQARWLSVLLLGFAVLTALPVVGVVLRLNRDLRTAARSLSDGASQIAKAGSEVESLSESLARGASEQAASIEETSASSEEISSIVRHNNERSQNVARLMDEAVPIMHTVNSSHQELAAGIAAVRDSGDKISKVVRMIDEIAFQTNILALNAAVEAARAGESGAGFAVVADEVRSLAHRSASAAKETSQLIEESVLKSRESIERLDVVLKATEASSRISAATKVETDAIRVASDEQARGIEQIASAISHINTTTQSSAAAAEQSAMAAKDLRTQTKTLESVVERLRVMVGE